MHHIAEIQNQPQMIRLLRARRRVYSRAKRIQGTVLLVKLSLPLLSLAMASLFPDAKAYITVASILIGLCDVLVLDRWHKARMRCAAKLQMDGVVMFGWRQAPLRSLTTGWAQLPGTRCRRARILAHSLAAWRRLAGDLHTSPPEHTT